MKINAPFVFIIIICLCGCKKEKEEKLPFVDFSFSGNVGNSPRTVSFSGEVRDADQLTWDMGNGQTATGIDVTHTYNSLGLFRVVAKARNKTGTGSFARDVIVAPYTKITISRIDIEVLSVNPQGNLWDPLPYTLPEIYIKMLDSEGGLIGDTKDYYLHNTISGLNYFVPALEIKTLNEKVTIEIYDYDFGQPQDELIDTYSFNPSDFLLPQLPFPSSVLLAKEPGRSISLQIAWIP